VSDELAEARKQLAALQNRLEESQIDWLQDVSTTRDDHTARLDRLEDGQRRQAEAIGRVEAGIREILALLRGNGGEARH
jgi:hypothetical protein